MEIDKMRQITTTVYEFDELSESAKETAIQKYREQGLYYDWWDGVYYDAKEIGKILGIDIDNIYFSGFSSQGDGACFEGYYSYQKGSTSRIRDYAPLDKELHSIADRLYNLQKDRFYKIHAKVKQSGHYNHSGCTEIEVYHDDYELWYNEDYDFIDGVRETLRDFMDWIYKQLEKEYDYLTSDESISETLRANCYEFLENGEIA